MKKKIELNRKLTFEKKTINELGYSEMNQIQGGEITAGCTDGCGPLQSYFNCSEADCTTNCTSGNNTNVESQCAQTRICDYSKGSICLCTGIV